LLLRAVRDASTELDLVVEAQLILESFSATRLRLQGPGRF